MKLLWGIGPACALAILAAEARPAQAAWNNVFQVCCDNCRSHTSSSYYGAPDACCNPCPPVCTTRYVQRCYYQPVTCYQSRTYYEPVTTYRTSYYYEPVTSYRYTCHYDPCTCSYQQVACPVTSYRMRSQCCPVQSWVQRCCQVPVTSYRASYYWEPVTTCCSTAPACPPAASAPYAAPTTPAPAVSEQRTPAPAVQESPERRNGAGNPSFDRSYPTPANPQTPGAGSSYRQVYPPVPAAPQSAPPSVKLERIVSIPQPTPAAAWLTNK